MRGGRWNPLGVPVIYTSLAYEGTLLEVFDETEHPDWRTRVRSHEIGRVWVASCRSLALQVPSYAARPWGCVVLNPRHPDFDRVQVAEVAEVRWDLRLF